VHCFHAQLGLQRMRRNLPRIVGDTRPAAAMIARDAVKPVSSKYCRMASASES
jgi:hypothetical protein